MSACPVCSYPKPTGWLVCEACNREVPAALHTAWQCAAHHAHAAVKGEKPAALIAQTAETERRAAQAIFQHLRLHGSAL